MERKRSRDRATDVDDQGLNDRPRDETISQTGPGIPDDTSRPVDISEEEEKRISDAIKNPRRR